MKHLAILVLMAALLISCGTPQAAKEPTAEPTPVAMPVPTEQLPATNAPAVTIAPTDAPATAAPEPTVAPAAAPVLIGAAPKGGDCPADHPVKGNIRDRNPNKGEKIYHLPGDNGYAQTKPERCFADAAEAVAAGYRAVK